MNYWLTPEQQDEIAAWYASPPDDDPDAVTEIDYDERDRQIDIEQINCTHQDAHDEPIGQVRRDGSVELFWVCPDCGLTKPTGRTDSVL